MLDPRTVGLRGALNAFNRRRLHRGPATLADRVFEPSLLMDIVLILSGIAAVSLSAQFVVPIWPVPSTGQIVGVLLVGYTLGAIRGTVALLLYIAVGLGGAAIFNQGSAGLDHLAGPTGGYLLAFVLAALLAGLAAARGWDRRIILCFGVSVGILFVIYGIGVLRLAVVRDYGLGDALIEGFLPLVISGIVKVAFVAVVMAVSWRMIDRLWLVDGIPSLGQRG